MANRVKRQPAEREHAEKVKARTAEDDFVAQFAAPFAVQDALLAQADSSSPCVPADACLFPMESPDGTNLLRDLLLPLLGMTGGLGVFAGSARDRSSGDASLISGTVTAGPMSVGVTVIAYDRQGAEVGRTKVAADSTYAIRIAGGYTGPVVIKAVDSNGAEPNYQSETTGMPSSLGTNLRAVAMISSSGIVASIGITPLTEIAARLIGVNDDDSPPASEARIAAINKAIGALFGVDDILAGAAAVYTAGLTPATGLTDAQRYGMALAVLSGVDSLMADGIAGTLDMLTSAMSFNDGKAVLSAEGQDLLARGVDAFRNGSSGYYALLGPAVDFLATLEKALDTTAPAAPALLLQTASDTGASDTDLITDQTVLSFNVTGEANATVMLFNDLNANGAADPGEIIGRTVLTGTSGTITSIDLAPGIYDKLRALQTDAAGNASAPSAPHVAITIVADAVPISDDFEQHTVDGNGVLIGGRGNDILIGGAGVDVFMAGPGDDRMVIDAADLVPEGSIDGGPGIDTLAFGSYGMSANLAVAGRISGIERIELRGYGTNVLTLALQDVVKIGGAQNIFKDGNGWNGLGVVVNRYQLVIDGDSGDTVIASGGWIDTGVTVSNGGQAYAVYDSTGPALLSQLLVDLDMSPAMIG